MDSELYGNKPSPDQLMTEARARIIWGEPLADVRSFLVSNGVGQPVCDARLAEFMPERNQELKRIGLRNLLTGIVLFGLGGSALGIAIPHASATSGTMMSLGLVLMVALLGLWKLVRGIMYLVRPQSEDGSIPDIESDPME